MIESLTSYLFSSLLEKRPPAVSILVSKEKKQSLIMKYLTPLEEDTVTNNGIYVSPKCLSIEKIFALSVRSYSISMLKNLQEQLGVDEYFKSNVTLDDKLPCLKFKPFDSCTKNEMASISIDSRSGFLILNVGAKSLSKL